MASQLVTNNPLICQTFHVAIAVVSSENSTKIHSNSPAGTLLYFIVFIVIEPPGTRGQGKFGLSYKIGQSKNYCLILPLFKLSSF